MNDKPNRIRSAVSRILAAIGSGYLAEGSSELDVVVVEASRKFAGRYDLKEFTPVALAASLLDGPQQPWVDVWRLIRRYAVGITKKTKTNTVQRAHHVMHCGAS